MAIARRLDKGASMDHTPNQYDTDYSRHVKAVHRDQALQSERDDAFRRKSAWYAKTPTQRHHEPFAHLLGVVAFFGAGYWIHKNHSDMVTLPPETPPL